MISNNDGLDVYYLFTGYEYDYEMGSAAADYYANLRYESSSLGRFFQPDPVGGDPTNPQSWNRYAYALNSPTNIIDPLGLCGSGQPNDPPCQVPPQPPITVTPGPEPGWWDIAFEGAPPGMSVQQFYCMLMGGCAPQTNTGGTTGGAVVSQAPTSPPAKNGQSQSPADNRPSCLSVFFSEAASDFAGGPFPGSGLLQEITGSTSPDFNVPSELLNVDFTAIIAKGYVAVANRFSPIVVPASRTLRGGLSIKGYVSAATKAREASAGWVGLLAQVDISLATGLVKEIKAIKSGQCKP